MVIRDRARRGTGTEKGAVRDTKKRGVGAVKGAKFDDAAANAENQDPSNYWDTLHMGPAKTTAPKPNHWLSDPQRNVYKDYSYDVQLGGSELFDGRPRGVDHRTQLSQMLLESRATDGNWDANAIMESFFITEGGEADRRQYGNLMDPAYKLPNGETNWNLVEEDRYIVDLEKAFVQNKGEVPLEFFLSHPEDIALLSDKTMRQAATILWSLAKRQDDFRIKTEENRVEFGTEVDQIVRLNDIGRGAAIMAYSQFPGIVAQVGDDHERGQELLNEVAPGLSYASVLAIYEDGQQPSSLGGIIRATEGRIGDTASGIDSLFGGAPSAAGGWLHDRGGDFVAGGAYIGNGILDGVGKLWDLAGGGDADSPIGPTGAYINAGGGEGYQVHPLSKETQKSKAQMLEDDLKAELGLSNLDIISNMSTEEIDAAFSEMEVNDPELFAVYREMAQGDYMLANSFYAADVIWQTSEMDKVDEAVAAYKATVDVQLQEVRDHNYTLTETFFEGIAYYGGLVMDLSVDATLLVQSMFDGSHVMFDEQYFQDRANFDTPAEVLGLEGTLTGLFLNIGIPAVVDPMNFFFMPGLSSAGRWGAHSVDDVVRIMGRATTEVEIADLIKIIRGISYDAVTEEAMLAALRTTPNGRFISAMIRGQSKSSTVLGRSRDVGKPIQAATDSVHMGTLEGHAGAVLTPEEYALKLADLQAKGPETIVLGINPDTMASKILRGEETLTVLRGEGFDGLDLAIKTDLNVGQIPNPDYVRAVNVGDDIKIAAADLASVKRAAVHMKKSPVVATVKLKNGSSIIIRGAGDSMAAFDEVTGEFVGAITNGLKNNPTGAVVPGTKSGGVMDALADQIDGVFTGMSKAEIDGATAEGNAFILHRLTPDDITPKMLADPEALILDWAEGIDPTKGITLEDGIYRRPTEIVPEEIYMPEVKLEEVEAAYKQHLLNGGDPLGANKAMLARQVGSLVGDFFKSDIAVARWAKDFYQPINADKSVGLAGSYAEQQVNQIAGRLYGSVRDQQGLIPFQRRIISYYEHMARLEMQADTLSAEAKRLLKIHEGMIDEAGGMTPRSLTGGKLTLDEWKAHSAQMNAARKVEDEITALLDKMGPVQAQMSDKLEIRTILEEMMEDFNRRHIATNPKWKDFLDEDGLVPQHMLQQGTGRTVEDRTLAIFEAARDGSLTLEEAAQKEIGKGLIPQSMVKQLKDAGTLDAATLNQRLDNAIELLRHQTTYTLPASPLELMAAATGGPEKLLSITQKLGQHQLAEFATKAHTAWVLDKVMRPRTGLTVSMDELLFGFHRGGYKNLFRFMEDRAVLVADSVTTAKGAAGWQTLPKAWQERLVKLQEYPIYVRQQERAFKELNGTTWETIGYKKMGPNTEYYSAANRTAQNLLSDKGFQHYMKGPEAFDEWFRSDTTAARIRELEFIDAGTGATRTGLTQAEVWQTYETIQEWMLTGLKKKDHALALSEWRKAALQAGEKGSTKAGPTAVPDLLLRGFSEVQGVTRYGNKGVTNQLMRFPGAVFNNPLNYRRGFNAEWVRASENARLAKLFASQNREIISNDAFLELLRLRYPHAGFDMLDNSMTSMADEVMRSTGKVSQRYVDELVEQKVIFEIENMQYSFTMESALGKKSRALAPFGKPYADMVGRWMRELGTRPQLRGWINDANFAHIGDIANKGVDAMNRVIPGNPRTFAFLSRTANTDFDLDRIQEDPIFGSVAKWAGIEELDVGVGLFLPHRGQNVLTVLLPGLGVFPVAALQIIFNRFQPDPITDPLGYEEYNAKFGEFVPSLAYSQPQGVLAGFANLILGGGTSQKMVTAAEAAINAATGWNPGTQRPVSQSWQATIKGSQMLNTYLADGKWLSELGDLDFSLIDIGVPALLDEQLGNILHDVDKQRATNVFKEIGIETLVPVAVQTDGIRDQNEDAWLDNAASLGFELPSYLKWKTPGEKSAAANWVRNQFYDMPSWERTLAVADNPGLAVNLVSMWKWSPLGEAQIDLPDNELPYSSGGSKEDFARHAAYRDKGYIMPMPLVERFKVIAGTVLQAKYAVKREAYSEAASIVNEERWNSYDEGIRESWDDWAAKHQELGTLPYRTGRELWMHEGDLRREEELLNPSEYDRLTGDRLPGTGFLNLSSDLKGWTVEMPGGLDGENLPHDVVEGGWTIQKVSPKLERLAQSMGLDWKVTDAENSHEMIEIWHALNDQFSEELINNPIFQYADPAYRAHGAPKSAGLESTQFHLDNVLKSTLFSPETKQLYKRNNVFIAEALQRKYMGDESWKTMAKEAKERWNRMFMDDAWTQSDPATLWNQAYGKQLGALDWVPDEPPPLDSDDAKRVYVHRVLDGDTIDVAQGRPGLGGGTKYERVRLLGWNAKELGSGGEDEHKALTAAIENAIENDIPITIVTDVKRYGLSDLYGRKFAWLYIGDEAWYNADTMIPRKN